MKKVRFLGLDVHAETIAVAVAEPDGEARVGDHCQSRSVGSQTDKETGAGRATAGLL
jgi:hypothetical protein